MEIPSVWMLTADSVENYVFLNDIFSDEEIESIIELGNSLIADKAYAESGGTRHVEETFRDSSIAWIYPNDKSAWIFERLTDAVEYANSNYFNFDLTGFLEGLQFTRYVEPHGHFNYHADRRPGIARRKLSMTLQLSDPSDYEGGDLEFMFGGESTIKADRNRGIATFFPSWVMHRVTPVTRGTRYSLVAWISGPDFK